MLDILMITYNRPEYTSMALSRLLDSCGKDMRVWVWQNGTDPATVQVVKDLQGHPRFFKLHISEKNEKLRGPTNWFWSRSDADYFSKVDDDCLLPDGWGEQLMSAHVDNPEFGVIGSWRFYDEDFVPELANRKIREFKGNHRLMMNCWVQGSGYAMKRKCFEQLGPIREGQSFPGYCLSLAGKGWQNGWYFPFIHEEHMDDPRSPHCLIKTDEQFMAQRPLSAINDNVCTLAEWANRVRYMARNAQEASPDPKMHQGWRKKLQHVSRRIQRLVGRQESWRAAGQTAPKLS
jgi:glycosyltransferase involved in cell wall biosynthesis